MAYLALQVRKLHLVVRRPLEVDVAPFDRSTPPRRTSSIVGCELHPYPATIASDRQALSCVMRRQNETSSLHRGTFSCSSEHPNADWVRCRVARDKSGFILTGVTQRQTGPVNTRIP